MSLGIEMMMKTMVKAIGLNPEVFIPQMEGFIKGVAQKVQSFDERLTRMEETNKLLAEQNAQLIAQLTAKATTNETKE